MLIQPWLYVTPPSSSGKGGCGGRDHIKCTHAFWSLSASLAKTWLTVTEIGNSAKLSQGPTATRMDLDGGPFGVVQGFNLKISLVLYCMGIGLDQMPKSSQTFNTPDPSLRGTPKPQDDVRSQQHRSPKPGRPFPDQSPLFSTFTSWSSFALSHGTLTTTLRKQGIYSLCHYL